MLGNLVSAHLHGIFLAPLPLTDAQSRLAYRLPGLYTDCPAVCSVDEIDAVSWHLSRHFGVPGRSELAEYRISGRNDETLNNESRSDRSVEPWYTQAACPVDNL